MSTAVAERTLAETIAERAGVNVFECYQCKRCTSGCPVVEHYDLTPNQIMRAVQLGRRDEVMRSRSIWLCTTCQTCTTRCPQDLDVARVFEVLRIVAQEEGVPPAVPPIKMFSQAALRGIRLFGRMYELGLMGELYGRMFLGGHLDLHQVITADLPMAARMFAAGKLKLLPEIARRGKIKPTPAEQKLSVGYYPGCSLHATAIDFGMSTKAVAEKLELELVEPKGWVCCGTSPAHTTDHELATVLPLRNLALYQAAGQDCVMMPCASCYQRSKAAVYDAEREPELKAVAVRKTGYDFERPVQVQHLLETLEERVGFERISEHVQRSLRGLKVVCYYGCLLTRPPKVLQQPNPEYPRNMDRLVEVLGAQPLDWSYKTECCGASVGLSQLPVMLELVEKILRNAVEVGAEAVIVACPLCHVNLDSRQSLLTLPRERIPIIYITELMGLALGIPAKALGLSKHLADPMPLLRAKGLVG